MKEFVSYNEIRNNGLVLARTMYDEGYIPDVIYASMRGGVYLANVISEFFKLAYRNKKNILYSTVLVHSYSGINENSDVVLDAWSVNPKELKKDSSILIVDDIFDSGATINFLGNDLLNLGVSRSNIKVAVHDYKFFAYRETVHKIIPDYWCRKHVINSEDDNIWIHYLSHELIGLSSDEVEKYYTSEDKRLYEVFKGIV